MLTIQLHLVSRFASTSNFITLLPSTVLNHKGNCLNLYLIIYPTFHCGLLPKLFNAAPSCEKVLSVGHDEKRVVNCGRCWVKPNEHLRSEN